MMNIIVLIQMAAKQTEHLISVGFNIVLPDDINGILREQLEKEFKKLKVNADDYPIISNVHCGVFYNPLCKGGLNDVKKTEPEMEEWYKKKKDKEYEYNIQRVYIIPNPHLMVAHIQVGQETVYAFISNKGNMSTTQFKKAICNGVLNGRIIRQIELAEPIKAKISVYRHYAVNT